MICPNCGREIPDGSLCPCTMQPPPLSNNPAVNVLKTLGSSSMFIGMTVLFSISALLAILSAATVNNNLYDLYYYAYTIGLDMDMIDYIFDAMQSTTVVSAVFAALPAILLAVALWLHFLSSRSTLTGNLSTAGLTICKVLSYLRLIGLCLITVMVLGVGAIVILAVLSGELSPYVADPDEFSLTIIMIVGLVIAFVLFFMVLAITYQCSIIRTINRAKDIAQTGMPDDRVSGYLVGMTYVVAVCSLISGVTAMFSSPMGGASTLCVGVAYILMAQLLTRYRREMNQVLYPPVMPGQPPFMGQAPYGQQPYGAVPQPGPADGFQQPAQPPVQPEQPPQDQPPQP